MSDESDKLSTQDDLIAEAAAAEDVSVPVRWQADGFDVSMPLPPEAQGLPWGVGAEFISRFPTQEIAQLVAAAPELRDRLATVLGWLEGSDVFATSHGAHSDAVEARKLLDRLPDA